MPPSEMNNQEELKTQCQAFRRSLESACYADLPLNDDFVRRFNGFLAQNPHVLEWKNEQGQQTLLGALHRYLVRAIQRKFSLATFQALVIQTPQVLAEKDGYGYTLLHDVCWYNPTALDVISLFAKLYPDAAKASTNRNLTPLHIACCEKAPLPVIRVLVNTYPRAIQICETEGNAPLQFACCRGAPLDVIQYLALLKPHLCLRRCNYGNLPLERAKLWDGEDRGINEFMTTVTTAAARVLAKRLCFNGLLREMFEQAAAYLDTRAPVVEVSVVNLALSPEEIAILFRRDEIQVEFREQIEMQAP